MSVNAEQLMNEQSKKLRQIAASTGLMAGSGGFVRYGTGTVSDVQFTAVVPQEDTVFTSFKVNGMETLSARGMSTITFKQGAYLPAGGIITGFAISSGSIIAYK
jgi:hypothetical protein